MPEIPEPTAKRAIGFFDGQNLYHHAMAAFGHYHPNYDPKKLFEAVCRASGWENYGVRFYTGTPIQSKDPLWHGYWANRLLALRRAGVHVTQRALRYESTKMRHADGTESEAEVPHEKGIDVRLALDAVRLARSDQLDVAVIFSQDQDLAEVGREIREISRSAQRWIKVVSAFPVGPRATAKRGIEGTDWFAMDRAFYDACLDLRDYRPQKPRS